MAAIKKQSLVDQVYDRLKSDIITLQIPLGARLNVSELQEALEVSCTPIREAINRLQQEGLVIYENNVGARILSLDRHDVLEIQELAMTLHCAAVRLAMKNGDCAVMEREFYAQIEAYHQAATRQEEVLAVHHMVGVFYAHCGNRRLDACMVAIQGQQLLLRYIYAAAGGTPGKNDADFLRMHKGILAGNGEEICNALQENADQALPVLLEYVERDGVAH